MLGSDLFTRIWMAHIRDLNLSQNEIKDLWNQVQIEWNRLHLSSQTENRLHLILHELVDPIRIKKQYQNDFAKLLE